MKPLALFLFSFVLLLPVTVRGQSGSATNGTVVLTIDGSVDIFRAGGGDWAKAALNQALSFGDRLRTGPNSRATVRMTDLTVIRVNASTTFEIQPPPNQKMKPVLNLRNGSVYLYSRDRSEEFQIRTPVAAGAIRGTEFNLTVGADGRTQLTLLDGEVDLSNEQGAVKLASGEQGTVDAGQAPRKTAMIDAVSIIQWALYYPGVLNPDDLSLPADIASALADSLKAYRSGDLLGALAAYPAGRAAASDPEKVYLAAVNLSVGQVGAAQELIKGLTDSRAMKLGAALNEVIAAVQGRKITLAGDRATSTELMSASYYEQSQSNLEAARQAAVEAAAKAPGFGFATARLAEMQFSFGRNDEALKTVEESLKVAPRNAQAIALKGFLLGAKKDARSAIAAFDQAIAADGSLANAWLGRGLMKISAADGDGGRKDLQVAATLEPNRSILRSYLGKAFSFTRDTERAGKELDLARKLDPKDPTPWLYAALLNQQENRVNKSVDNLEHSQDLNDNRSVFRSRLLLDQDRAVRGANLASIFRDAGMREQSVREATRAVDSDYANFSAHLFLASSYDELRDAHQVDLRYETPWLSELLVANLLMPVGGGSFSQNVSQQEYTRLFEGDHLGVSSLTEYTDNGDFLQYLSQYGNIGNTAYSVDGVYRTQNGDRKNEDLTQKTIFAKVKQQITDKDSVFIQAIVSKTESGDLTQYYYQTNAHTGLRVKEDQLPIVLAGYHREWAPGIHTLFLAGYLTDTLEQTDPSQGMLALALDGTGQVVDARAGQSLVNYRSELEIFSGELQQIIQTENHNTIAGVRYQSGSFDTTSRTSPFNVSGFPVGATSQSISSDFERVSAYAYHYWTIVQPLQIVAGLTYDRLQYPLNYRISPISTAEDTIDKVSPKIGFTWTPVRNTTLRGSYTRSLGGVSFDESVRLEPTQIAGFSQAYRSILSESVGGAAAGAAFETIAAGLEQKLNSRTYLGVEGEIRKSEVDRLVGAFSAIVPPFNPSSTPQHLDYKEKNLFVTLNQLVGERWSLGVRYRLTESELNSGFTAIPASVNPTANHSDTTATIQQLGLFAIFNESCGFFAKAESLWTHQSDQSGTAFLAGDDFWQFNLFAGYRFARRHAEVRLGLLNITDQDYKLNPLTPYAYLPRDRTFTVSVKLNF